MTFQLRKISEVAGGQAKSDQQNQSAHLLPVMQLQIAVAIRRVEMNGFTSMASKLEVRTRFSVWMFPGAGVK